ncbi:putative monooxygenase [Xylariaceae sp. FL0804]|nr:putative monooxygenase [Xylariaceae sp. FL0804]
MATETRKPHVLIVGAGLGGLALAQSLRKNGVPFEIFERDDSATSRTQGRAIGMHTVLEELQATCSDLPDLRDYTHHLKPLKLESQFCFYTRNQRFGVINSPETPVLRANRMLLRKWLALKIPVQWGKKLKSLEQGQDEVTVHFEDGTSASGDILVGADGVYSIVRQSLLQRPNEDVLRSFQLGTLGGQVTLSGAALERQLALGHSAYGVVCPGLGGMMFVGLDKINDDYSGDYFWFLNTPNAIGPDGWLETASQSAKRDLALKYAEGLEPRLREIIQLTPLEGINERRWPAHDAEIADLPVGRITLLGDAIHPMAPFRGEGGMHALEDALRLGKALGRVDMNETGSVEKELSAYQEEMLSRGVRAVRSSRDALRTVASTDQKLMSWGFELSPMPEETISLKDYLP